jgi:hypothetical protein
MWAEALILQLDMGLCTIIITALVMWLLATWRYIPTPEVILILASAISHFPPAAIAIGSVASDKEVVLGNDNNTKFFCPAANHIVDFSSGQLTGDLVINIATRQIGLAPSSIRYKRDITDLEINTSKIYDLRPVSFEYINGDNTKYFGLIAEEVAKSIPELARYAIEKDVIKGSTSEKLIPDGVQYSMLSVLLLKEIQKHEKEINAQQKTIDDQNKKISGLELSNETQQQQINDLLKRIEALEKK